MTQIAPGLEQLDAPPTLRDLVFARLKGAIISGKFAPGQRLVERSLCDQLGVSRSVVREALRYLEGEGLVEMSGRAGPVVSGLDWDGARQIYDIRLLLEARAAEEAARVATAVLDASLARALRDIERAAAGAGGSVHEATARFYRSIFEAAGHWIAWEIVERLNGRISRLRALTLAATDRTVPGPVRMARIAEAIAARDPSAARLAVEAHLKEAATIAQRLLAADQTSFMP